MISQIFQPRLGNLRCTPKVMCEGSVSHSFRGCRASMSTPTAYLAVLSATKAVNSADREFTRCENAGTAQSLEAEVRRHLGAIQVPIRVHRMGANEYAGPRWLLQKSFDVHLRSELLRAPSGALRNTSNANWECRRFSVLGHS